MSAKDIFHSAVKNALVKEGWNITQDPLIIKIGTVAMQIDLGAEKIIAAEKAGEKIAIEIKSFLQPSAISEFHQALGQFINYRFALLEKEPERKLYLAVPLNIYKTFLTLPFIQNVLQGCQVSLIIYNPEKEVIVQWIN
jgi:hypothetical protein